MKKLFSYLFLCVTMTMSALVYAASPSVVGSWNITFFLEPGRSTGATQCVVFTLVPGTVAGEPMSGTWTCPTFPGWTGQWVQLGDHVRWFGVTSAFATAESGNMEHNNIFGGVSFNHYNKTTGVTSTAGNWNGVRVAGCRVGEQHGDNYFADPSAR